MNGTSVEGLAFILNTRARYSITENSFSSMKMIPAEFPNRPGVFRLKPIFKLPKQCPRCGAKDHIGKTTCTVRMHWQTDAGIKLAQSLK